MLLQEEVIDSCSCQRYQLLDCRLCRIVRGMHCLSSTLCELSIIVLNLQPTLHESNLWGCVAGRFVLGSCGAFGDHDASHFLLQGQLSICRREDRLCVELSRKVAGEEQSINTEGVIFDRLLPRCASIHEPRINLFSRNALSNCGYSMRAFYSRHY